MLRKLIVTHHAPDLDAITSVWLLKRFDTQHYGTAKVTFVNSGDQLTPEAAQLLEINPSEVVHVDTGQGEFDHHQPERGHQFICATSLVYDHICQLQPDKKDDDALKTLVSYVTEIDHFREIDWPESGNLRYTFMLHELIKGQENIDPHDDESMLHFGMTCLDAAYAQLTVGIKAHHLISEKGIPFELSVGPCLAVETENDDVIKVGQKQGFAIVVRKDPSAGNIRIKARPDANLDLKAIADVLMAKEPEASWYYHPSGKMLLNSSSKKRNQNPSHLSLPQVIVMLKELYG